MAQNTSDAPEPMVAYDHTDLLNRPKRIWNWGNIPLPGLLLPALGAAFGFAIVWLVTLLSLSAFLPFLGISVVTSVLYIGPPVGVYFVWGRPLPSALTLSQQVVVWADFWFQPKRLQGMAADREPEEMRWQVILWQPGSPRWQRQYEEALAAAARHGSSFAGQARSAQPFPSHPVSAHSETAG
ncbi:MULTISPECIES: hypothetical protein [unclassified Streptomyces]|uniref:hypothetical protein n=1 Tax=unclassified Streptomyces TaxID=2593676 RepID=UPI002271CFC2|nr:MULTISPECIES: hypothetical protein [unclassified Streptomyces]MCY0922766.1 hypothetical protein [Streptomyces sp. H27-G5]MCY0961746.1 hypothetical protein [Streptomyces sp. H27-H5]